MQRWTKHAALLGVVTLLLCVGSGAAELRVCHECQLRSLEEAVAMAAAGDTIVIEAGEYSTAPLRITKPLVLIGRNRPLLRARGVGTIIEVRGVPVHIRGLVLTNTGFSALEEYAAIKLIDADRSTITDVETRNCAFGIALYHSAECAISQVRCYGTGAAESFSGNGIHLWKSPRCTIERCTVQHHRDGLYFEFSSNCSITQNYSASNLRYGLHFMFSDSNVYRDNVFQSNGAGVAVMFSRAVRIEANTFADSWGPSSYGLLLKDISQSAVVANAFLRNTVGVYMEGSNQTVVVGNLFRSNGWALKILGSCSADTLTDNDFIANTFDVMSNTFSAELYCARNYWDQYRGYDLTRDGYGDVPYRPVSVFAVLVERVPMAVLLLRSFFVELLVYMERAFPSLIPERLIDEQPRMVPARLYRVPLQAGVVPHQWQHWS